MYSGQIRLQHPQKKYLTTIQMVIQFQATNIKLHLTLLLDNFDLCTYLWIYNRQL